MREGQISRDIVGGRAYQGSYQHALDHAYGTKYHKVAYRHGLAKVNGCIGLAHICAQGPLVMADDEPAFTLVEAAGDQESPVVAGDGTGGYLVAWQDDRNGDWDIYGATVQDERRVIAYEYDGLCRLTEASYSTGELFRYDYDPVGNRAAMTLTTPLSGTEVTTYTYDAANRLTYVGGVALTWDDNGNLLEDHEGTDYAYDTANRLTRVVQDGVTYTFAHIATGDRLAQSVGGAVRTYTLDLYGGLTQVLGDGASVYLYGLGRIGEEQAAGWLYHLGDALGSVRQLAAGDGEVVLDRSYRP